MQSNSVNGQPDIANITVVTDERQVIVPQPITSVVEVNNPGPQGPVGPVGPQGPSVPFTNIGNDVYATTSSLQVTGSFTVSGSSTFTNIGPAVFSGSVNATSGVTMSSALVSGNVQVLGTASINVLQINTTINSTGSNILGDASNDTQTLYGSVIVPTGSLVVTGSITSVTPVNGASGLVVQNPVDAGSSTYAAQFKDALGRSNIWIKSYSVGAGAYTGEMYVNNIINVGYATYINGPSIRSYYNNLLSIQDGFGPTYIGGNVGVRTSTPSASLHIKGATTSSLSSSLLIENSSSAYSFRIKDNGDLAATSNYITISSYDTTINGGNNVAINGAAFTPGYIYRNGTTSGFITLANDGTVASSITLFGSAHATLPSVIRVVASSSFQITGSLGVSNTASFGGLSLHNQNRIDDVSMLNFDTTNNYYQVGKSGNDLLIRTAANNLLLFGGRDTTLQTGVIGGHFYFKGGNVNGFGQSNFSIADYNGSNTRFFVSGSGNVGIGTITPGAKLDVNGITYLRGVALDSIFGYSGNNITYINNGYTTFLGNIGIGGVVTPSAQLHISGSSGSVLLIASSSAGPALYVSGSGNVGIGTTAPLRSLDVRGTARLENTGNAEFDIIGGGGTTFRVASTSTQTLLGTLNSFPLTFYTNASERMRIDSSGNVGIGTASPSYTLDVSGSGRFTNGLTITGSLTTTAAADITGNSIVRGQLATTTGFYASGTGTGLNFYGGTTGTSNSFIFNVYGSTNSTTSNNFINISRTYDPTSGTGVYNTLLIGPTINQTGGANGITRGLYINPTLTAAADFRAIETTAGNVLFQSGSTPLMLVSSSGFIGIGTTTDAGYKLDVSGSVRFGTNFAWNNATQSLIVVGKVGINNASPLQTLDMIGGFRTSLSAGNAGAVIMDQLGTGNAGRIYAYNGTGASANILLTANGFSWLNGGNFAIGTTTDSGYKLDVSGSTRINGTINMSGSLTNYNLIDYSGSVYNTTFKLRDWAWNAAAGVSLDSNNIYLNPVGEVRTAGNYLIVGSTYTSIGAGYPATTARLTVRGSGATSATTAIRVENTNASASMVVLDNGYVGINTASAQYNLDVNGTARIGDSTNGWQFSTNNITIVSNGFLGVDVAGARHFSITDKFSFSTYYFRVAPTTGNILIGTSTDAGFKLDVSGSGRFTNGLTVTGSTTISNILTLTPQSPLPSGVATGSFAVSSSVPPKPYFYDGTTWNALY